MSPAKTSHINRFTSLLFLISFSLGFPSRAQETVLESGQFQIDYFQAMTEAKYEIFQQKFEYPFLALLSESELANYYNLPTLLEKKEYMQLYWKKNNPNPLLPENEGLMLFMGRCTHVQRHFPSPKPPFYDDRGKYFLRYGKPEQRFEQPGEFKFVQAFSNRDIYKFAGRSSRVITNFRGAGEQLPKFYSIPSNETWIYPSEDGDPAKILILHFVKRGKVFKEVDQFEHIIDGTDRWSFRLWFWSDLMKERALALGVEPLNKTMREIYAFENEILSPTPMSSYLVNKHLLWLKSRNDVVVASNKVQMPPKIFIEGSTPNDIAFHHDTAQFREPNGRTRVEISLLSPIEDNLKQNLNIDTLDIEYAYLLEDSLANPMIIHTTTGRFPLEEGIKSGIENAVGRISLTAPSQRGEITLQVKDSNTGKIGYSKHPISIRDFSGAGLMISDIQLLTEIDDSTLDDLLPIIQQKGQLVAPYPTSSIDPDRSVLCYFEVYNLRGNIASGTYITELTVSTKRPKGILGKMTAALRGRNKASIGLAHTRVVEEDTDRELLGVDFGNLKPGDYLLEITVQDASNEHVQTSVQRNIRIGSN